MRNTLLVTSIKFYLTVRNLSESNLYFVDKIFLNLRKGNADSNAIIHYYFQLHTILCARLLTVLYGY